MVPSNYFCSIYWSFEYIFWEKRNILLSPCKKAVTWSCKINRIHHWCSVGTEKPQPKGPTFQWETRLAEFSTERWTRGLGFFLEPLNTNDRFFFSYTTTVRYSSVYYLLMTSLRSMFTVNDARSINQLGQRINSALNNERMVISSKWIYKY